MGELANYTIDQVAGALALTLGSIGGLCLILFKSRVKKDEVKKDEPLLPSPMVPSPEPEPEPQPQAVINP